MSLRRTALKRKTELRRSEIRRTPLLRKKPLRARQVAATKRPRDTGPSRSQRAIVLGRSGGHCEICWVLLLDEGRWLGPHSVHHRRPRRAGGDPRPSTNDPSNLLLLCGTATTGCHQRVEADRVTALANGWLLHATEEPAAAPALIGPSRTWVRLTDDGDYEAVAA